MSYAYTAAPARPGPIARGLAWLDERGPVSWVVVMIGAFIFGGPLGLLVLGFILITGRFGRGCRRRAEGMNGPSRFAQCGPRMHFHAMRPTGNSAFDAYRSDTLARLEREQEEFEAFLARLREARDKAEFDQYMDERARAAADTPAETAPAETGTEAPGRY